MDFEFPEENKIYKHQDESLSGYNWATEKINFLSEMFKMFPDYINDMFLGNDIKDAVLNQFGKGETDPYKATDTGYDGNNPFTNNYPGRGYDENIFGFLHPHIYQNQYWGTGYGSVGKKSINGNPTAGETNFVNKRGIKGGYAPDDPVLYAARVFKK